MEQIYIQGPHVSFTFIQDEFGVIFVTRASIESLVYNSVKKTYKKNNILKFFHPSQHKAPKLGHKMEEYGQEKMVKYKHDFCISI